MQLESDYKGRIICILSDEGEVVAASEAGGILNGLSHAQRTQTTIGLRGRKGWTTTSSKRFAY